MAKFVQRQMTVHAWDVARIVAKELKTTVSAVTGKYGTKQEQLAKAIFIYSLRIDLEIPSQTVEAWLGVAGSRQAELKRRIDSRALKDLEFSNSLERIEEAINRKRMEWENE